MYICVCVYMCVVFPGGTSGKEPVCQCRTRKRCRLGPWAGRSPAGGNDSPLQYSRLDRKIPSTEEAGGLQCVGLGGVRHDWSDWVHTCVCMHGCVLYVYMHTHVCSFYIWSLIPARLGSRVTWKKFRRERKIDLELHPECVTSEKSLNFTESVLYLLSR